MVFNQLIGVEDVRLLLQHDAVIGAAGHHMEIGQYVSLVADDNAGTGFDTLLVLVKHFQHNHRGRKAGQLLKLHRLPLRACLRRGLPYRLRCRLLHRRRGPVRPLQRCAGQGRTGLGLHRTTAGAVATRSARCSDARDRVGRCWTITGFGRAVSAAVCCRGSTGVCSTRWDRASNSADCTETSCSFPRYSTSQPNR